MKLFRALLLSLVPTVCLIGAASAHAGEFLVNFNEYHATGNIRFASSPTNTLELPATAIFDGVLTLNPETRRGTLEGIQAIPEFTYPVRFLPELTLHPTFRFMQENLGLGEVTLSEGDLASTLNYKYLVRVPESSIGIENTTKECSTTMTQKLQDGPWPINEFLGNEMLFNGTTNVAPWQCPEPHGEGISAEWSSIMNHVLGGQRDETHIRYIRP